MNGLFKGSIENSKKKHFIHMSIFLTYFISYVYLLIHYSMSADQSRTRYYILLLCILIEAIILIKNKGLRFYKKADYNSLLLFIPLGILFYIQSIIVATSNGGVIPTRTLPQIFLLSSPPIYAYFLLNNTNKNTAISLFKITLGISIIGYFSEHGHTIIDFFNPTNYATLFTTSSFIESSIFSEIFLQLFMFFNYFTCIDKGNKQNALKPFLIISALFTVLCGKRLALLIVFISPLTNYILKRIHKKTKGLLLSIVLTIIFTLLTLLYFGMLEHRLLTNIDIYKLSTGRDYILSIWEKTDYMSLGYGSSLLIIGRYLELDLIEILLELGMPCLVLACFTFLNSAKRSDYSTLIMIYCLLNLLTASSLPHSAGLILMFVSAKTIEKNEVSKNDKE